MIQLFNYGTLLRLEYAGPLATHAAMCPFWLGLTLQCALNSWPAGARPATYSEILGDRRRTMCLDFAAQHCG